MAKARPRSRISANPQLSWFRKYRLSSQAGTGWRLLNRVSVKSLLGSDRLVFSRRKGRFLVFALSGTKTTVKFPIGSPRLSCWRWSCSGFFSPRSRRQISERVSGITTTLRSGSPPGGATQGVAARIDRLPELQRKLLTTTQTQHRRRGIIRDRDLQEVQASPDHKRFAGDDRLFRIKTPLAMNQGVSDANGE